MANDKSWDAIVIGSGIGGLTASALLAKRGLKTLLFEKGAQPGGYAVSFRRGEYLFDATGAFIGGCSEGGEFYQILKEIGAHEEVDFIPIHHIRNIYPDLRSISGRAGSMPIWKLSWIFSLKKRRA